MSRTKSAPSRIASINQRVSTPNNWGRGRSRYAPGRDARRKRVFMRDGFQCQMCKQEGVNRLLSLHSADPYQVGYADHYIPLAHGGPDTESNQWVLCKDHHDEKSKEDSQGVARDQRDFGSYQPGLS